MKPLVLWCRWHGARLQLRGRDQGSVWGTLQFDDRVEPFRFAFAGRLLEMGQGETKRQLVLDEMGVEQRSS